MDIFDWMPSLKLPSSYPLSACDVVCKHSNANETPVAGFMLIIPTITELIIIPPGLHNAADVDL
jgi:hypothetical protein